MSTAVYPPVPDQALLAEEKASAFRELSWLLLSLQDTLASLRTGLQECIVLIQPTEPPSTLVLSSPRSEALKGYVTRVGDRIVKGEMQIKMYGLPHSKGQSAYRLKLSAPIAAISGSPRAVDKQSSPTGQGPSLNPPISSSPPMKNTVTTTTTTTTTTTSTPSPPLSHPTVHHSTFDTHAPTPGRFYLPQLTSLRQHLQNALYTLNNPPKHSSPLPKSPCSPHPTTTTSLAQNTITYLTHLLNEILSAKSALIAPPPTTIFPYTSTPAHIFDPSLPPNFAFDLTVREGALVVELRTLDFISSHDHDVSASVRRLFGHALGFGTVGVGGGAHRPGVYEEIGKVFTWDGKGQVRVKDKVRVESQDPKLMAVLVKVRVLEHSIRDATVRVEVVMEACTGVKVGGGEGKMPEETHEAAGLTVGLTGAMAPSYISQEIPE